MTAVEPSDDMLAIANPSAYTADTLLKRIQSHHRAPQPGDARHEAMLAALETLFATHQTEGTVTLRQTTRAHIGRLSFNASTTHPAH